MNNPVFIHTAEGCPAYRYCEAIKAQGIEVPQGAECLFSFTEGRVRLEEGAALQIQGSGARQGLLEGLASAGLRQLEGYQDKIADQALVDGLMPLHERLFESRLEFWKAMIGAARSKRDFTDVELDYYQGAIAAAEEALESGNKGYDETIRLRALCAHDRRLKLLYALQFDADMIRDVNRLVGNALNARPTLIVGDKGIAKTQVAKFVMGLYGKDPIIISVKGDMMSDEFIGKIKHDPRRNAFVFQDGPLVTAMKEGLPILLDEINFGDQAIIARLQDILLRKPGEQVFVQESGEEVITIQPGFAVFATANEASLRYRHREVLDPAIRDRFDIVTRSYPDLDKDPFIETPGNLLRLALSSAVDEKGLPSTHLDLSYLEGFVALAHVTQYLYTVPSKDVTAELTEDSLRSVVLEESQPLMTDCITPRTVSNVVEECRSGNVPDRHLDAGLIDQLLKSLDQAGSHYNYELAQQAKLLLAIDAQSTAPSQGEAPASPRGRSGFQALSRQARSALLSMANGA